MFLFNKNVSIVTLSEIAKIGTGSSNTNEELDNGGTIFCSFARSAAKKYF